MSLRFTSIARLDLRYLNSPITTQVTNARTPRHNPTIKLVLELGSFFPITAKKKRNIKSLLCSTFSLTFCLTRLRLVSQKEATKQARKQERKEGWKDGRMKGRMEVRMEGRKERRNVGSE